MSDVTVNINLVYWFLPSQNDVTGLKLKLQDQLCHFNKKCRANSLELLAGFSSRDVEAAIFELLLLPPLVLPLKPLDAIIFA